MKKDDIYIEILKFGRDRLGEKIIYSELISHLKDRGYNFEEFSVAQLFTALYIDKKNPHGNSPGSIHKDGEYYLEHAGYFNLLEYEELTSARRSATQATWFASIAIIISVISTAASVYYSDVQLRSPIAIKESQVALLAPKSTDAKLSELTKINGEISRKLDSLQTSLSELKLHNESNQQKSLVVTP